MDFDIHLTAIRAIPEAGLSGHRCAITDAVHRLQFERQRGVFSAIDSDALEASRCVAP